MDAKLFKREDDFYSLKVDGIVIATSNGMLVDYNLSLKNCQTIANGYDLDELAKQECIYPIYNDLKVSNCPINKKLVERGFTLGFQKALEILGDKKYSEDDVKHAIFNFANYDYKNISELDGRDKAIQSLQQTEWDVWLVMACGLPDGCTEPEVTCTCDIIPSLDPDGCLILKRI